MFFSDEYIWNQCCLLTQPAISRPLSALNSRWRLLIPFPLLLARETRAYWPSRPHKDSGNEMLSPFHPPPSLSLHPPLFPSPLKGKARTVCQSRKRRQIWQQQEPFVKPSGFTLHLTGGKSDMSERAENWESEDLAYAGRTQGPSETQGRSLHTNPPACAALKKEGSVTNCISEVQTDVRLVKTWHSWTWTWMTWFHLALHLQYRFEMVQA